MPKILIADDEPYIRMLLEQTLSVFEDEGAEILVAENGKEALDLIIENSPDIAFLDVMMPKMSGFDVCSEVKLKLKITGTYIVLLTAKGQEVDKKTGMEAGADLYMTKPFYPEEVVKKVREVLTGKQ